MDQAQQAEECVQAGRCDRSVEARESHPQLSMINEQESECMDMKSYIEYGYIDTYAYVCASASSNRSAKMHQE